MHLVIFKSTFQVDKYIWNSYTVHSGTKFSDCLSAWKYLISKKIPELGEENPLSEFCTWANAQVLAGVRSLDPRESSSIAGLQITSRGMEDKKNSKAHFPAMRTESAVKSALQYIWVQWIMTQRQKLTSTPGFIFHKYSDCHNSPRRGLCLSSGKKTGLVFASVLSKKCRLKSCH